MTNPIIIADNSVWVVEAIDELKVVAKSLDAPVVSTYKHSTIRADPDQGPNYTRRTVGATVSWHENPSRRNLTINIK